MKVKSLSRVRLFATPCPALDLIDRVPDELWTEVHDIVRRQGSRPSTRKRNAKKAKWLSQEALQIAVKRREAKSKGEKKDILI